MKRIIFILTVVAVVGFLGCRRRDADSGRSSAAARELVFFCGAGIRPAVADIITAFEAEHDISIVTDYAGSEVLLSKIKLTQTGDLYMPGDKYYIAQADKAGMIEDSWPVFYWVPTILVKKGNPKNITSLDDLLGDGLNLGLGDPKACAIGRTTKQLLEKNGMS
ncbi:MAG: substrate-binding domain-containing protein [Planctomycetes bacterium]|nr:substrate-binding domain-containing protein [Planctomycetota bacterium]